MSIGAADDVVEALEAVGTGVDLRLASFNEALVPDSGCGLRYVVESCRSSINMDWELLVGKRLTPDSEDFEARGLQMGHYGVNVGVVGQETDLVGVISCEVTCSAIDVEF